MIPPPMTDYPSELSAFDQSRVSRWQTVDLGRGSSTIPPLTNAYSSKMFVFEAESLVGKPSIEAGEARRYYL
jgi:hypothetical protein